MGFPEMLTCVFEITAAYPTIFKKKLFSQQDRTGFVLPNKHCKIDSFHHESLSNTRMTIIQLNNVCSLEA
jgi:hypothetical protein